MRRRLHDLLEVVVEHAEALADPTTEPNPRMQRSASGRISGLSYAPRVTVAMFSAASAVGAAKRAAWRLRASGVRRRDAAVRRVDHDGRPALAVDGEVLLAAVDPEVVVAADVARRAGRAVAAEGRGGAVGSLGSARRCRASAAAFSAAAACSAVSVVAATCAGRSSGVSVAVLYSPWMSGCPHGRARRGLAARPGRPRSRWRAPRRPRPPRRRPRAPEVGCACQTSSKTLFQLTAAAASSATRRTSTLRRTRRT